MKFKAGTGMRSFMKVVLFFFNEDGRSPESMRCVMYGRYNIGGFMLVYDERVEMFCTRVGGVFTQQRVSKQGPTASGQMDFLLLSVDDEEKHRIEATCKACVTVQKPFNLRDLLLIHIPFREVEELSIDTTPTLNNTQAMILILRECLNPDNRLREGLEGLHSRQTFMEDLYSRLLPFTVPIAWSNLSMLVKWEVGDRSRNEGT